MSIIQLANIGKDRSKMRISNPIIFERWGMWYLQYREVFENGTYKKKQQSTKVKVVEKSLSYMTSKWLPAKFALIEEDYEFKKVNHKNFGYFHDEFLSLKSGNISHDRNIARSRTALEFFGPKTNVRDVSRLDIKRYLNTLYLKQLHRDTVKSYFYMLSGILELAVDAGVISINPCNGVKIEVQGKSNKDAKKPFSNDEVEILLGCATGEMRNYLGIAFNTGMSPEEIIALMPQDIDFDKKTINIRRVITKGQLRQETKTLFRTRMIPLFDAALPYLTNQMENAREARSLFIFCKEDGQRYGDIQELRGQKKNNTKWYGLLKSCNIEDRPLKNTRHTWAVQAVKSGKFTLQEIADILGHANLRMLINHYADYINGNARNVDPSISVFKSKLAEGLAEGRKF